MTGIAHSAALPELAPDELRRYSRQIIAEGFGVEAQRRLKASRVLVVGAGGLGSPAITALAAAGVGTLGIVDDDTVDLSNLPRQTVHGTAAVGRAKALSAAEAVAAANSHVTVRAHQTRLRSANALSILADYDVVLDGADNFATRYLIGDAAELVGIPHVWGSALQHSGQLSVFHAGHGPRYRDLFPEPPEPGSVPSCDVAGVWGTVTAIIGSGMAGEAIKLITGTGQTLLGRLQTFDAATFTWSSLRVRPDPGVAPVTALVDYEDFCGAANESAVEITAEPEGARGIDAQTLAALWAGPTPPVLIDVRSPGEHALVRIEGSRNVPLAALKLGGVRALGLGDQQQTGPVVLYCKSGVRSAEAVAILTAAGLPDVVHLRGGILEWIEGVEPELPRY